ncbi:MAG: 2-hydroxyglutaryl-CoA dehydratase [Deltaproteobacteria bacterium]|nr:2-hydroxyglutaryl-CoA dehydratase [Deltaproteobacteria bacterium]
MIVAGIDIGAATAKAVILRGDSISGFAIVPTGYDVSKASESVIRDVVKKSRCSIDEVAFIVSTGYGRNAVSFSNKAITEIICHASGVNWMFREARTVIDIGGQDSKVMSIDDKGKVYNFVMNDKCAAGTGRFLEVMSEVLDVGINNMGSISLQSTEPCSISSTCTVFAESEMVTLRAQGKSRENIIAGIHKAMAHRVAIMGKSVGFRKKVVFTGGVAKNEGVKKALEDELNLELIVPEEPQIVGALGAALLARAEEARKSG